MTRRGWAPLRFFRCRTARPATVLYVYCCPGQSPIRSKMLYSCNVLPLQHAVKQIEGMHVGKKVSISRSSRFTRLT